MNESSPLHLAITGYTATTAAGTGIQENIDSLLNEETGLSHTLKYDKCDIDTWIGKVNQLDTVTLPETHSDFDCRNNQLLWYAINQDNFINKIEKLREKYSNKRIGVFIGTTTSGIQRCEQFFSSSNGNNAPPQDYNHEKTTNIGSCTDFFLNIFGLEGMAYSISTACSSSAKVFGSAHRAIQSGLCDAAVVGGVDTMCLTILYGFNSLQLVSSDICRPFANDRAGISIGEAAGFAILEPDSAASSAPLLIGYGESSDAYHMSTPHPKGKGARLAIRDALRMANLDHKSIDYINLHGTGTMQNDAVESLACESLFGRDVYCSSTKGWTGHTLGAAGIIEAIYSLIAIQENVIFKNLNTNIVDPNINCKIATETISKPISHVMSNSFGFGGSNAALIFGKKG